MAHATNLTGQIFGRLLVIGRPPQAPNPNPRASRHARWECLCECDGRMTLHTIRADHLLSGHTQSCGCLLQEWRKDAKK